MKFFFKDLDDFLHRKMTLKVRILQFVASNNFDQKCSKKFQRHFCDQWSISFSLKGFYQIPLTWSKYYTGTIIWDVILGRNHNIIGQKYIIRSLILNL